METSVTLDIEKSCDQLEEHLALQPTDGQVNFAGEIIHVYIWLSRWKGEKVKQWQGYQVIWHTGMALKA